MSDCDYLRRREAEGARASFEIDEIEVPELGEAGGRAGPTRGASPRDVRALLLERDEASSKSR